MSQNDSRYAMRARNRIMATQATTLWERIPVQPRKALVWGLWFVTWVGLIGGFFDRSWFTAVVIFFRVARRSLPAAAQFPDYTVSPTGSHCLRDLGRARRLCPGLMILMYITLVGLATNLFCPLARLMYLMPWNRSQTLSLDLVGRIIFRPPMLGKFEPRPRRTSGRRPAHPH